VIPPDTHRQYSFTDHSVNAPSVPHPGDRLDGEIDRTNAAVNEISNFLEQTFDAEGNLLPGAVGEGALREDVVQGIEARVTPNLQPYVTRAEAHAIYAGVAATDADASAREAASHAQRVLANTDLAKSASDAAMALSRQVAADARAVAETQAEVDNFASDSELAANMAHNDARLAGAWAEYMEGGAPLPAMVFAHTSITGQHWSSRWWANKAAAAFGELSSLYLGAWPEPPTTTATGEPIPVGALYYNTTTHLTYVWDGTSWQPFYAPTKALTLSLVYVATAEQTVFDMRTPDIGGNTFSLDTVYPEPTEIFVNGSRVLYDEPPGTGDYVIAFNLSTISFLKPLRVGTVVIVDIMSNINTLPPNRVTTRLLLDFDIDPVTGTAGQIDGVRATFPLALSTSHAPITITANTELLIFLDGVAQQPGAAYSTSTSTITFTEPPIPGCINWGLWFAPGGTATPTGERFDYSSLPANVPTNSPRLLARPDCPCFLGSVVFTVLDEPDFISTLPAQDHNAWQIVTNTDITGTDLAAKMGVSIMPSITPPPGTHAYIRISR
jgi:hypothetical protein